MAVKSENNNQHPKTLVEAVLTKGVIDAISYAVNNPGVVCNEGSAEFNHLMDMFQDWIPHALIDHSQWWICHYWSSGHTCSECQRLVSLFQYGEHTDGRRLRAECLSKISDHALSCSWRKRL